MSVGGVIVLSVLFLALALAVLNYRYRVFTRRRR
jgi:hypothetical protein